MMTGKVSNISTVITILVSTLGTGILKMPASFNTLGWVGGTLALMLAATFTFFTLYSLSYTATAVDMQSSASYRKLAGVFSGQFQLLVDFTVICSSFGSTFFILRKFCEKTAYLIVRFLKMEAEQTETVRTGVLCGMLLLAFVFFTREDLSYLRFISKISFAGVLYYLALTAYYAVAYGVPMGDLKTIYGSGAPGGASGFINAFVSFIFALHCQCSYLNIYADMANKAMPGVTVTLAVTAALMALIYSASGLLGYKAVGCKAAPDGWIILDDYVDRDSDLCRRMAAAGTFDTHGVLPLIGLGLFLVVWFGAVILMSFSIISTIQSRIIVNKKPIKRHFVALPFSLVLLLVGFPEKVSVGSILDGVTAVFMNPLSYLYPSIFMIKVSPSASFRSVCAWVLLAFSVALSLYTFFGFGEYLWNRLSAKQA